MVSDCGFPRVVQGILHQNSGALPYTGNMGAQVQGDCGGHGGHGGDGGDDDKLGSQVKKC